MRRDILGVVVASVASATVSAAVTWYFTNKAMNELYEQRLGEEVKASIEFLVEQGIGLDKVVVTDASDEALLAEQTILPEADSVTTQDIPEEEDDGLERVFPGAMNPPIDTLAANQTVEYHKVLTDQEYEETPVEIPEEDPNITVISKDIFMENATGWPQKTLTYFSDGGVLDESGNFVETHQDLIGGGNYPFGFMSEDPEVVYIRNKKLEQEFEVLKDPGEAADFLAHELQTKFSPDF